jgi:hypothetical protein
MKILKKIERKHQTPILHQEPAILSGLDTSHLPVDPNTRRPIAPMAQPGYYPDYHVLNQQAFWDEATRKVVLERVNTPPPIRFFSPEEVLFMKTLCDRLLPQDDRDDDHKIPIVNFIDERLYEGRIDGYRYEDMPPDPAAYRLGLQAIEQIAQHMSGASFIDLTPYEQDQVLLTLHDHNPPAAHEIWQKMSVKHFWAMLMQDVVTAYYAHPYAWDEIGFGGPAYPRGYMRLEHGRPEPWESDEKRYEWEAPANSLSDIYLPHGRKAEVSPAGHGEETSGQSGTH